MLTKSPVLSVIIASFNTRAITDTCLSQLETSIFHLKKKTGLTCEVIVVENASTDGSVEMIKKKHRVDVKPSDIRSYLSVFIDSTIVNSSFSSQTKEKLITEPKEFGTKHEVSDKLAKSIMKKIKERLAK